MQRKIDIIGFDEVSDIFAIMRFRLNSEESYAKSYVLPENMEEDLKIMRGYLETFTPVDPKFKLLFDLDAHSISFMSEYHFSMKLQKEGFNLEELIKVISEDVEFKNKVIAYYLEDSFSTETDLKKKILFECEELDIRYRYMLLQFVEFYDEYMDELFQYMRNLREELVVVYSKHVQLLEKVSVSFDLEELVKYKKTLMDRLEKKTRIRVTFSLINQYLVCFGSNGETVGWLILGVGYQTLVEKLWKKEVSIAEMCSALSDDLRLRIVREAWSEGEITPTLICKKFGLPYSVVGYHLDILKRSRILCAQVRRRNTAYQINTESVKELSKLIGRFAEK